MIEKDPKREAVVLLWKSIIVLLILATFVFLILYYI